MFDRFRLEFPRDEDNSRQSQATQTDYPKLTRFLEEFGGSSFRGGVYRVVSGDNIAEWDERISLAYPEYEGRITCFAYDWLGRAFALDWNKLEDGEPAVLMFEIGTGYALQIPCNLESFHELELPEFTEEALAISFFDRWRSSGGRSPAKEECVGYKRPLFLGGEDELWNLEICDLDVYWHIVGQAAASAKGKPEGTVLRTR